MTHRGIKIYTDLFFRATAFQAAKAAAAATFMTTLAAYFQRTTVNATFSLSRVEEPDKKIGESQARARPSNFVSAREDARMPGTSFHRNTRLDLYRGIARDVRNNNNNNNDRTYPAGH